MIIRLAIVAGILALMFCGAVTVAGAASSYAVTDLGNLGGFSEAYGINNNGQIVGVSTIDSTGTDYRAFLYDASSTGSKTMTDLFGTGYSSVAYGINDSGQIVGSLYGSSSLFECTYSAGTRTDLLQGNFGGSGICEAYAINNSGTLVGATTFSGDSNVYSLSINSAGAATYLVITSANVGSTSHAYAINAGNNYVGDYNAGSGYGPRAYYWNGANGYDLGTLGGAFATATGVNATSQIVGWSSTSTAAFYPVHAFLYSFYGDETMHDLGVLASGDNSEAESINSAGQIVGYSNLTSGGTSDHAFIYTSTGGITDLNTLIPSGSGWTLESATAINNSGWIVGVGLNSAGATDAFLLTPSTVVQNPGDANGDGKVDINDLTIVLTNYGKTGQVWSQGSMDGDPTGTVDINDLTIVLTDYGKTYSASMGIKAVPEPATLVLLAIGAIGLLAFTWRKRRAS
jgi:probable HAF family extracellular repeat protein